MASTSRHFYGADLLSPSDRRPLVRRYRSFRSRMAPEKKQFASQMRRNPTDTERILWSVLRKRQVLNAKFSRQARILGWIADFYCPEIRLVVEVDGSSHDDAELADRRRNHAMVRAGFSVVRISNETVRADLANVLKLLRTAVVYCRSGQLRNF